MAEEKNKNTTVLPMLALRGLVIYPGTNVHFDIARDFSKEALKKAMLDDRKMFVTSQMSVLVENPDMNDLYSVGTICSVKQLLRLDDGIVRVFMQGEQKAKLKSVVKKNPYYVAEVKPIKWTRLTFSSQDEQEAVLRLTKALFKKYFTRMPNPSQDVVESVLSKDKPIDLFNTIMANISVHYQEKQRLLEINKLDEAFEQLMQLLQKEINVLSVEEEIYEKVHYKMDQNHRNYLLREQLNIIRHELGDDYDDDDEDSDNSYLEKILSIINIDDQYKEKLIGECKHLSKLPTMSQEANVIRSYLDVILSLPWDKTSKENLDIKRAQRILDKDHYGMEKVKERILELLAVRAIKHDIKGQIICLVGPPGVGKTSIASSVAASLRRKFARVSLGGVSDESEIRGHRKTYLGSMPGRIIKAYAQAGTSNPLILLDEIDKLGRDYKGDPASALLEVLDPEQNKAFVDNYLEIPFDLSNTLFITTANTLSTIPGPLLDRMEVIELKSYTREEKFNIAKKHLVRKQLERHGLNRSQLSIKDSALYEMIDCYTREAGVRKLERTIADACRKAAKLIVSGEKTKVSIDEKNIENILGNRKFKRPTPENIDRVGVVNGLAWTSVGGEMLEIEAIAVNGNGKIKVTGNLGDVMKESAEIAVSYVRSIAKQYGIDEDFYKTKDIHIHAPEGAVPKDGPSAGVTITTALVSALSEIAVRGDVAMTGEISLTGRVMPIGGLREKTIAAFREGKTTVIIPKDNEPDLSEIDDAVRDALKFIPVTKIEQVLENALIKKPTQKVEEEGNDLNYDWCEVEEHTNKNVTTV